MYRPVYRNEIDPPLRESRVNFGDRQRCAVLDEYVDHVSTRRGETQSLGGQQLADGLGVGDLSAHIANELHISTTGYAVKRSETRGRGCQPHGLIAGVGL